MSLLEQAFEPYKMMNKVTSDDGFGGFETSWQEGASINGAMRFDSSIQARRAEQEGVSSVYTFITKKNIILEYHDVIKRIRDGKIFRVTSDGDDSFTPDNASLDMRLVTCEEWKL